MINDYKKLPIGKWLEIRDVQRDEAIEDKYTKTIAMLSILSDVPEEELYDLKLEDFSRMTGEMAFLLKEVPQVPVCDRYKIGGYDLVLVRDLKELTASQFIDYQTFIKDTDKYIVELLSIFLIPKGKKYCKDYDIVDVQKAIRENLSIADAMSVSAFFLDLFKVLYRSMQIYLTKMLKKMKKKMKVEEATQIEQALQNLESVGVGLL
jgi:hypothetical protein